MNSLFEPTPRFKGAPPVCLVANLPAFKSAKEVSEFQKRSAGDHPNPIIAQWTCKACGCIHFWSTAPTDSNGRFKGGADKIPDRIRKLMEAA